MQTGFFKQFAIAVALAGAACAAQAHRQWMIPHASMVEGEAGHEAWVTIDGAVSEQLFVADFMPLRLDGLTVTSPDGATLPAPAAFLGKHRSTVDIPLPKDGTYRITLATANVMGSYKLNGETKRFRATEQTVKEQIPAGAVDVKTSTTRQRQDTFVTLNKPSSGALKPRGSGLEMVPLTSPTALHAGEKARMRFLLNGQPLPNFPFSMIPGGVKYRGTLGEVRFTTDAKGEANVTLPAPNLYWLSASWPARPAGAAEHPPGEHDAPPEGARFTYSATLEVLPE
jgi:uncharacterized GH25 family protein